MGRAGLVFGKIIRPEVRFKPKHDSSSSFGSILVPNSRSSSGFCRRFRRLTIHFHLPWLRPTRRARLPRPPPISIGCTSP
nr:hypothetical protein Iba_chr03cCG12710 [Ipomoea batatas]GME02673.1 hypothetical protein Iba_scaffold150CG0090 [Ipomoea batatas]GME19848.1 hypothetical protein Iba_scaffold23968CG0030 [Ipomoea batatas]